MRSVADFYQDCQAVAHAVPPLDVIPTFLRFITGSLARVPN